MTKDELTNLQSIVHGNKPWEARLRLAEYLKTVKVVEAEEKPKRPRTDSQHRALFLWFGQIEQVCANQGVTADMVYRHTTQIAITKESLHHMCKTLIKALFNIDSTKDIEKTGHLDKVIDHFTALFAQEGVELPPFPNEENKNNIALAQYNNLSNENYPEYTGPPTI